MYKLILAGVILAMGTGLATAAPRQGQGSTPRAQSQPAMTRVAAPAQQAMVTPAPVAPVATPAQVQPVAPITDRMYDYGD